MPRVRALQRRPFVYGVLIAYAVVSTILMAIHAVGITSEHALLIALILVSVVAPARAFVWDWLPFLAVVVMFSDVGSMVGQNAALAHTLAPIATDRTLLGGNVAAVWLQQHLRPAAGWLDVPLALVYLSFFIAPLAFGLWLWLRHRNHFGLFVSAYIGMMAVGFLIHVFYPETPPWLAARDGFLPPVDRITVSLLDNLGGFGQVYGGADHAPYGAMPALHVAVPALIAATVIGVRGLRPRSWLWLAYPVTMAFATLYLGEHYLLDALAGLTLGVMCYACAVWVWRWRRRHAAVAEPPHAPVARAA